MFIQGLLSFWQGPPTRAERFSRNKITTIILRLNYVYNECGLRQCALVSGVPQHLSGALS